MRRKDPEGKARPDNSKNAAVILVDRTPFVVLRDEGRTQLTADQVDFELNENDIIFVERDLPEPEGGNSVYLSQGTCIVRNKPEVIVLPRSAFKMLNDSQQAHAP